jgi:hypothetical protein
MFGQSCLKWTIKKRITTLKSRMIHMSVSLELYPSQLRLYRRIFFTIYIGFNQKKLLYLDL